jgi:signal transduction histidine kinase
VYSTSRSRTKRDADRPTPRPVTVLVVEDSEDDAQLMLYELRRHGFDPAGTRVDNGRDLSEALEGGAWDVVLSDHKMPGFSGDDALKIVKAKAPDVPFIVVSGTRGEDQAVEVMRAGASDFIVKSRLHRLAPVIERALDDAARRREQHRTEAALSESREQLRQAQRLEAIGRLAGGVAHDFNNLMATILTYADIALGALPDDDSARADIEEIKRAGTHAAQLTRDLLVFSGQRRADYVVLDLGQVIDGMRNMLESVVGPSITLDIQHDDRLWNVRADRVQIERMIMNLAANARDAMPSGGTLTLATANATVPSEHGGTQPPDPGEYVRLEVQDTGRGIAPELVGKVFEPFLSTKGERLGTGLGLAVVYGIVQQCDGFIAVESPSGKGATFTIYLPRTTENVTQPAA